MKKYYPFSLVKATAFISLVFFAGQSMAQAPIISYGIPKEYTVGEAVKTFTPNNTGGAVPPGNYQLSVTLANTGGFSANASGNQASFPEPGDVAIDQSGNLYFPEAGQNIIIKVSAAGAISTFAGSGVAGATNGTGTAATFYNPYACTCDAQGNVYVGDGNGLIREITPAGVVTTFAGTGIKGANFTDPTDLCFDKTGALYVVDGTLNNLVKISGGVTTVLATGFTTPFGVAVDASGYVYVADLSNRILKTNNDGTMNYHVFAGSGTAAFANGTGAAASFNNPNSIKFDGAGNLYVDDTGNNLIREITPSGVVTSFMGMGPSSTSFVDGIGASAGFEGVYGLVFDGSTYMYTTDELQRGVRRIGMTGYTISPALSAGLSFDVTTGIISGTPTVAQAATNYTITAYNFSGSSKTTISITVNTPTSVAYGTADFNPANQTVGEAYSSDNVNVATIVAGKIHIVGVGTATIVWHIGSAYGSQGITVTPAPLNVNANAKTGLSGYALPAFTITYKGFVNGETDSSLNKMPKCTTTATSTSPVGTYPITPAGGVDKNYTFIYKTGTLTLESSSFITAIPTQTYGAADFYEFGQSEPSVTSTTSNNSAVATIVSGKIHITGAGTATIGAHVGNVIVNEVLKVNKAALTITADNKTRQVNVANPPLTLTYTGFVNSETSSVLTVQPIVTTTATTTSPVGTYPINIRAAKANNYVITFVKGTLTVTASGTGSIPADSTNNTDVVADAVVVEPQVSTAVSPNGDGINDVLTISNVAKFPKNKLMLMDRSGAKIFEAANYDNINKAFDGHSNINGAMEPRGTYFYMFQYTDAGVTKTKTGYFVLKY